MQAPLVSSDLNQDLLAASVLVTLVFYSTNCVGFFIMYIIFFYCHKIWQLLADVIQHLVWAPKNLYASNPKGPSTPRTITIKIYKITITITL